MQLKILVSRHSAFYSPLIATIAGPFLSNVGLSATYGVLAPGQTSREMLHSGAAHIIQSAVSSNWGPMEKGIADLPVHFAQINIRDGFFLAAREAGSAPFAWKDLEGRTLLADHGGQPLAMLRYAAHVNGVDWNRIHVIDAGSPEQMLEAFRDGQGDFIHLQGPAPHQLEMEGQATIRASVGASMPPVAFSSLVALPEFLQSETAVRFLEAYREARRWVREASAETIADTESSFFPSVPREALRAAIADYQSLGCWNGDIEIPQDLYEQSLNVFEHSRLINRRQGYAAVVKRVGE
ncbi:MAG: ABC transporter substrate-binding protein [Acidobacteria bacterium]|nr:ABC transporter substrate-binding protein [Acidobacteriota bacterium]